MFGIGWERKNKRKLCFWKYHSFVGMGTDDGVQNLVSVGKVLLLYRLSTPTVLYIG